MRIGLRCPLHARAGTELGQSVRAFGTDTFGFDIREASTDEYPVAISFRSGRSGESKIVYRRSAETGQMFRSVGRVQRVMDDRNFRTFHEKARQGFNALLSNDDALYEKLKAQKRPVYPDDLGSRTRWIPLAEAGLASVNGEDIKDRRREAQGILDRYRIVGDSIWEPCREPVFVLQRGTTAWTTYLVDLHVASRSWEAHYFAADEHDRAVAWMDVQDAEIKTCPHVEGTVTYAPDFSSAVPGERQHIAHVADLVIETMRSATYNIGDYPAEAIILFGSLKKFTDEFDVNHSEEAVENAILAISRLCELEEEGLLVRQRYFDGAKEGILAPYKNSIVLHVRRFEDRRVSFDPITPAFGIG
jgi:hypothetical protein